MPSPSAVEKTLNESRRLIAVKDLQWQRQLAGHYADAMAEVLRQQTALAKYVEQQKAKGAPVSPSWLSRDERYLSLQSQLYQSIHGFGLDAFEMIEPNVAKSVREGLARTEAEVRASMGGPDVHYPGFGADTWAIINQHAMKAGLAMLDHDQSPLRALLERDLPESALAAFRKEWTNGLFTGRNPNDIARRIARQVGQLSLGRAQLIARTELHRAYREGKLQQFKDSAVVDMWTWRSATDDRTCGICYSMHGTEHPLTEPMVSHPNCRCAMIPKTKSWEDLGFSGMQDTRPQFESGDSLFDRLPADMQLRKLGPSRFKMYQEGMPLSSMIRTTNHPLWGPTRSFEPLGRLSRKVSAPTTPPPPRFPPKAGLDEAIARLEAVKPRWSHATTFDDMAGTGILPLKGKPNSGIMVTPEGQSRSPWFGFYDNDGNLVATSYITAKPNGEVFGVSGVAVKPGQTGKGHATGLYDFIQDNTPYNLYSGVGRTMMSEDGKAFVTKWLKKRKARLS